MKTKVDKRQKSIKSKLMAAIAMLMVAAIMMVSTTYAWFTLSTAPEVTGITTAVGANGNLEMALMPTSGILDDLDNQTTFNSLDGTDKNAANRSWGNLVDVSELYGLERISLLPSELYLQEGKLPVTGSMLSTPEYGSDGRVIKLQQNTTAGVYDSTKTSFFAGTTPGVRALGVSSSMTPRKLALRNAISAAATYAGTAKTVASQSLSKNGGNLGTIAVEHYGSGVDNFTKQDAANLLKIATDLLGTADAPGALNYIDKAIGNYMVALAASDKVTQDAAYSTIQSYVDAGMSASEIVDKLSDEFGYTVSDSNITTAITKLEDAKTNVGTAKTSLQALVDGASETVAWTDLYNAIKLIADINAMEVAGKTITGTTKQELIDAVMDEYLDKGSVSLVLNSGSGVYSEIADLCGDYQATVVMTDISAQGITVSSVKAVMKTKTTQSTPFLTAMATFASGLKAPETGGEQMPMAEFYGYILDLAFRTNASASDLLLQTTPVDRIYDGEGTDETLGHGSTMTFTQANETVTNDMIKGLMDCIRVVFFNPTDGTIYGEARLTDYVEEGTSVKGSLKLYNAAVKDETGTVVTPGSFVTDESQAKLMTLTQNAATQMSVLVYLDGESVTNAKVANALSTMTGSMNLQFSSSATLVPMQYADLMGQAEKVETPDDTPEDENGGNVTP